MLSLGRSPVIGRESIAATRIPYVAHVGDRVVKTAAGHYLVTHQLRGIGFECADDGYLNGMHERLNQLWRNLASPNLALWVHLIRDHGRAPRRGAGDHPTIGFGGPQLACGSDFAERLESAYRKEVAAERLLSNDLYVTFVHRPGSATANRVGGMIQRRDPAMGLLDQRDALDACAKIARELQVSLAPYDPRPLGVYDCAPVRCSSLLEFLGRLVNGEWQRMPLPRGPIAATLVTTRLLFGNEAIEYRMPDRSRVAAFLGIKEYPTPSYVGQFDRLLSAPFPLIATQSFAFIPKASAQALLQRQYNRMVNAGDFAVSQADELKEALDALTSNDFVMGEHHFSLQVLADVGTDGGSLLPEARLRNLNDRVALARSVLADTGMLVAREDLAIEAAFWAQLPGHFAMRPRKAPITSRNFAAMAPFHNYPTGRATGHHWGEALTVLVTPALTPYHFSLHADDAVNGHGGRAETGHTLICGPTGSGKTVLIGFLVALLFRRGVTQVIFDKDRGLEILVRALGGAYQAVADRTPTGFNPLQLPTSPANVEFLKHWLLCLVNAGGASRGAITARAQADLDRALQGTLTLDRADRRLSRLIEYLDPTDPEGPHGRLARWAEVSGGDYAWAFDNAADTVVPRMSGQAVVAFDVTDFLANEVVRPAITLYLLHLVRSMLDGRRLVCWIDEFWRLIADSAFEEFAKDGPKTWRKLNAVMCLATQSVSDVLSSSISRTLIEQTPTKILFPNLDADSGEYVQGLGMSRREFRVLKHHIASGSRRFMVKQSGESLVCQLDLSGLPAALRVISGRQSSLSLMRSLIEQHGEAPDAWLSEFLQNVETSPRRIS
ncbi:MAG: VirB4 family type IV secretion/conjugal transfer ATPase [Gammaproteobacteria bacterium]|nr:VirB4 family type IV secretion/conjugal transfer ATPase [Gammaproteobacteria bacterium]